MRKLVTLRCISDVSPIPDADAIEVVTVDGWKIVTKKGEFEKNDPCVYFEIDSVLPIRPEFEFLRKSSYIKTEDYEGFRLKTIKLRKQVSQGLVLPLRAFPDMNFNYIYEDQDLSGLFGVIKYEPKIPVLMTGTIAGAFPTNIPKTDEERIQNLVSSIKDWTDNPGMNQWEVTEKVEGSSLTVFFDRNSDTKFGVCSRNWMLKEESDNTQWKLINKLDLKNKLEDIGKSIAIQGELIGPGVQGNHYKLKEHKFVVFNIFDIENQVYYSSDDRLILCNRLGLDHVPTVSYNASVNSDIHQMLFLADGNSNINSEVLREGLVWKNLILPEISFKIVSNVYLLKEK
jgi:RNA ligase (TIGR02306 family)